MGQIVSLVNQKGGVSKSTTSVHLCYWLIEKKKKKTLLIDADTQGSSSGWIGKMEDIKIPCKVIRSPDDLLEQIPELATDYDFVVIDSPANLSETNRAILFRSDLAIIPVQPSRLDIDSTKDVIRLVKQAQSVRGGLPTAVSFVSRATKNTLLKKEAIALLGKNPSITLLSTVIHQKQIVADSPGQKATVWDLSGREAKESAFEYEQLFKEVLKLLS